MAPTLFGVRRALLAIVIDGAPTTILGWYAAEAAPSAAGWWIAASAVVAALLGLPVAVARLPAGGVGDWTGVVLLAVAVVAAVVGLVADRGAWLAGAGLALLLWAGRRLSVLDHAVLVTSLPEWLDRLAVAAGCGAGAAAIVIGVRAVLRPVSPSAAPRPG